MNGGVQWLYMSRNRRQFYVYIMASESGTLYIGVTNNLQRRVQEHKQGLVEGFSKRYGCKKLVYCEYFQWVQEAIVREKQLKDFNRNKKVELIEKANPKWRDVSVLWD